VKGLKRLKGHRTRQARPILAPELKAILGHLDTGKPLDVRDAAILALGWAGALRQSEIVTLDWAKHGEGRGVLVCDARGVVVRLITSKTSQDQTVDVVIPKADMPAAHAAVTRWAKLANLQPGQVVFSDIRFRTSGKASDPLTPAMVARIVRRRVHAYAK